MRLCASGELRDLVERSEVLSRDGYGEKVLLTAEGTMVKIFRRKHLLTSALFCSYAKRFCANAERLRRLGIATIDILGLAYSREEKKHLVSYRPLAGVTLRDALTTGDGERLLHQLAGFMARLHRAGIYFRSVHFGNVVVTPAGELGLIDVADLRVFPWSLGAGRRDRNFRHMLRYAEDREAVRRFGAERFLQEYLTRAGMTTKAGERLQESFLRSLASSNGISS